jgi:hypothetical protein
MQASIRLPKTECGTNRINDMKKMSLPNSKRVSHDDTNITHGVEKCIQFPQRLSYGVDKIPVTVVFYFK